MIVTGCDDCPLHEYDQDTCQHPEGAHREVPRYGNPAPDWCPLRKAPLTIALKGVAAEVDELGPHCGAEEAARRDEEGRRFLKSVTPAAVVPAKPRR